MRYAMIMAGGSGTRLWPMSRAALPKQLIPFLGGKSLLQLAVERLEGLVPPAQQCICAGEAHRDLILRTVPGTAAERFYGEPEGRDTLNAVGLVAAELCRRDPDAIIAVFTADHVIQPVERFRDLVSAGYQVVEKHPEALVTFGVQPTHPATAYGYLELGESLTTDSPARIVRQFREKPDQTTAEKYWAAGPGRYLWNSGMFIWRARTLLDCILRYAPENHAGLMTLAQAWPTSRRGEVLARVYPTLKKISVDYAVMEPASRDPQVKVVALPLDIDWLDVGSWPAFKSIGRADPQGNVLAPESLGAVILDSRNNLLASSDPQHILTAVGVENLIVIHTPDATLVCRMDKAEDIKKVHGLVAQKFGPKLV